MEVRTGAIEVRSISGVKRLAWLQSAWYPIALVVLAPPQCWAGGKIYEMQSAKA